MLFGNEEREDENDWVMHTQNLEAEDRVKIANEDLIEGSEEALKKDLRNKLHTLAKS